MTEQPPVHFRYALHFGMLAVAVAVLFLISHWDILSEPLLPTFAISGALHAVALVLALRAPAPALRQCLFIVISAALSILTLYIGIIGLQLAAALPANQRLNLVLGVCAASGATTYGSLIRLFWMPGISSRSILAIAMGCAAATLLAFSVRSYVPFLGGWWLAAGWWFAFSCALRFLDEHPNALSRARSG
jgi:hypothetical protein